WSFGFISLFSLIYKAPLYMKDQTSTQTGLSAGLWMQMHQNMVRTSSIAPNNIELNRPMPSKESIWPSKESIRMEQNSMTILFGLPQFGFLAS
ncbi:hypothetical protein ACJX0J_033916, partial [Zea mays]